MVRCDCPQICKDNPDKTFEQLIEMGLICKTCANSYREFSAMLEEEDEKLGVEIK